MPSQRSEPKKFLVAFSFAGAQRQLVESIAEAVEKTLGSGSVYLDSWFKHVAAGLDGDIALQRIYEQRSILVVPCISKAYGEKPWPIVEQQAIRSLLFRGEDVKNRIFPIRVGDGDVEGIVFNHTICLDVRQTEPAQAAEWIVDRFRRTKRVVYLADCPPDELLTEQRKRIGTLLADCGWLTVSSKEHPGYTDYETRLARNLEGSLAFVQILGALPWQPGNLDRQQFKAAKAQGIRTFRFRRPELSIDSIDDPEHRDFVSAQDVIACGFEDFKKTLESELDLLWAEKYGSSVAQVKTSNTIQPFLKVVIRARDADSIWKKIMPICDRENCLYHQVGQLEVREEASPCHGFLVICDQGTVEDENLSTTETMLKCREIQLRQKELSKRQPVGLMFWPPPLEPDWSKLLRANTYKLKKLIGEDQVTLGSFFREVRELATP